MTKVKFCSKSTITEAWVAVLGTESKFNEEEIAAINNEAGKKFSDLKRDPTLLIIQKTDKDQPAFWTSQFSRNNGMNLTRIGHRYLSVHAISNPMSVDKKYTNYSEVLKPEIDNWLDIYSTVLRQPASFAIERIIFGYKNTFLFDTKGFDVSKYFNVNVGVSVGTKKTPFVRVSNSYSLLDESTGSQLNVRIDITPSPTPSKLHVETTVTAEKSDLKKLVLTQKKEIFKEIQELKETSKSTFFGFATKETHTLMGAEYV